MACRGRWAIGAGLLLLAALQANPGRAELPPEDECPTLSGIPGGGPAEDAVPVRLREGMVLEYEDLPKLGSLIPAEVWRNRSEFFVMIGSALSFIFLSFRYLMPGFHYATVVLVLVVIAYGGRSRVRRRSAAMVGPAAIPGLRG